MFNFIKIGKNNVFVKSLYLSQILSNINNNIFAMENNENQKDIFSALKDIKSLESNDLLSKNFSSDKNYSFNLGLSSIDSVSNEYNSIISDDDSFFSSSEIKLTQTKILTKDKINSIFDDHLFMLFNKGFENIVEYINYHINRSIDFVKEKTNNDSLKENLKKNNFNLKFVSFDIKDNISYDFIFKNKLEEILCINNTNKDVLKNLNEIFIKSDFDKLLFQFSLLEIVENINKTGKNNKKDRILNLKNIFNEKFIDIFLSIYIKGKDFKYNYVDDSIEEGVKNEITQYLYIFTKDNIKDFLKDKKKFKKPLKESNKDKFCIGLEEDE